MQRPRCAPLLVCLIALSIIGSGCQVDGTPRTISFIEPGKTARINNAPYTGTYRLFTAARKHVDAPLDPIGEVLASRRLQKGERLGFQQTNDGQLTAAAGDLRVSLKFVDESNEAYVWQMTADEDQRDPVKTSALITVIVIAVVVGVVIVIAAYTSAAEDAVEGAFSGS